jgi:hypothetical protein
MIGSPRTRKRREKNPPKIKETRKKKIHEGRNTGRETVVMPPKSDRQGLWERVQHFLKYHTDLNVRIRTLKVLPGPDKNPPDFMTFLNHTAPLTEEQRPTILDALNRTVTQELMSGNA